MRGRAGRGERPRDRQHVEFTDVLEDYTRHTRTETQAPRSASNEATGHGERAEGGGGSVLFLSDCLRPALPPTRELRIAPIDERNVETGER